MIKIALFGAGIIGKVHGMNTSNVWTDLYIYDVNQAAAEAPTMLRFGMH